MLDPHRPPQNNPQTSPPPHATAPPAHPARLPALTGAGLSSVSTLALRTAHAPWPAVLTLALAGLAVVLTQSVLQALAPQDSADRLTWWTQRWAHRTRHHPAQNTPAPDTPPPADPDSVRQPQRPDAA